MGKLWSLNSQNKAHWQLFIKVLLIVEIVCIFEAVFIFKVVWIIEFVITFWIVFILGSIWFCVSSFLSIFLSFWGFIRSLNQEWGENLTFLNSPCGVGFSWLQYSIYYAKNSFKWLHSWSQHTLVITNTILKRLQAIYGQFSRPVDPT